MNFSFLKFHRRAHARAFITVPLVAAIALSGRPASLASSVTTRSKALVESSTCSENSVVSLLTSTSIFASRSLPAGSSPAPCRRKVSTAQIHVDQQDMLALKPCVECFEPEKRRKHQSRADNKHERQRHLRNDESLADPELRAFNDSAGIRFHRGLRIHALSIALARLERRTGGPALGPARSCGSRSLSTTESPRTYVVVPGGRTLPAPEGT